MEHDNDPASGDQPARRCVAFVVPVPGPLRATYCALAAGMAKPLLPGRGLSRFRRRRQTHSPPIHCWPQSAHRVGRLLSHARAGILAATAGSFRPVLSGGGPALVDQELGAAGSAALPVLGRTRAAALAPSTVR